MGHQLNTLHFLPTELPAGLSISPPTCTLPKKVQLYFSQTLQLMCDFSLQCQKTCYSGLPLLFLFSNVITQQGITTIQCPHLWFDRFVHTLFVSESHTPKKDVRMLDLRYKLILHKYITKKKLIKIYIDTYYSAPCSIVKESVFRCNVVPERNTILELKPVAWKCMHFLSVILDIKTTYIAVQALG